MTGRPCVVAGVDFSEISPFVVRTALGAARRMGLPLRVLHALDDLGSEDDGAVLPALRQRIEDARRETRAFTDDLIGGLGLSGAPDLDCEIVTEDRWKRLTGPGSAIELLVLGAPHPGSSLGSFGAALLRRCACPLLVARRPTAAGYRKILVGVDLSSRAEQAWNLVLKLAEPDAKVVACLVGAPETASEAAARLTEWVKDRSGGVGTDVVVLPGRPRDVLVRSAREGGFDLLAVGRSGHGALHDLLLGSTARTVAHEAPCDVLVAGARDVPTS